MAETQASLERKAEEEYWRNRGVDIGAIYRDLAQPSEEDVKDLPAKLYHGTTADRLRSIFEVGLNTSTKESRNFEDFGSSTEGYTSFSERESEARFFALAAAVEQHRKLGHPVDGVVLIIDTKKARKCWNTRFFRVNALRNFQRGAVEWVTPDQVCEEAVSHRYLLLPTGRGGVKWVTVKP
jgi:hypothetical protein